MRRLYSATLVSLTGVLAACNVLDPEERLIGMWEFTGPDGEIGECPDLIAFHPDGDYEIWNDCYGEDPSNPLVETGSWRLPSSTRLELGDRELLTAAESPWGEDAALEFTVFELSSDTLRFASGAAPEDIERYRRFEPR